MSPPQCRPVSVSSQSEASDKASVCQAWRRCGVVSAAIPLSQQSNSATSMVVPIASQASTIVDTNNQRHVSYVFWRPPDGVVAGPRNDIQLDDLAFQHLLRPP